MSRAVPPALDLAAGADRVRLDVGRGGRLASLVAGGRERLLGPGGARGPDRGPAERIGWGCYLMAPWAGRLAAGAFAWRGRRRRVPGTHGRHAIHGIALDATWAVQERGADHAVLTCDLATGGWPLGGSVRHVVELAPGGLTLTATVTSGVEGMPAAVGWHPWFARPEHGDLVVRVEAEEVLATDEEVIPDTAHVGWPDLALDIATGEPRPCYVVHTPPHAACVEPQTAWPNALALADAGARELGPGEALTVRCRLSWRPTSTAL